MNLNVRLLELEQRFQNEAESNADRPNRNDGRNAEAKHAQRLQKISFA